MNSVVKEGVSGIAEGNSAALSLCPSARRIQTLMTWDRNHTFASRAGWEAARSRPPERHTDRVSPGKALYARVLTDDSVEACVVGYGP